MKVPKTTVVSLRLLPALLTQVDAHAAIEGVDRSRIIRDILEAFYAQAS